MGSLPESDSAQPLSYETPSSDERRPRPKWVYLVVAIYLLLLTAMLLIPALAASAQGADLSFTLTLTIYASVLTLCGFSLVILPVRVIRRRPVSRRSIWFPIIASGLLAATLFFGAAIAAHELLKGGDAMLQAILLATIAVWAGWAILFWRVELKVGPERTGNVLYRLLIAGSVLELLVAVPANVFVRRREDCCAGVETGIGICIGVSIMIVALGPSVLILYLKRRKRITPPPNLRRN
jgi:hypothetical protein